MMDDHSGRPKINQKALGIAAGLLIFPVSLLFGRGHEWKGMAFVSVFAVFFATFYVMRGWKRGIIYLIAFSSLLLAHVLFFMWIAEPIGIPDGVPHIIVLPFAIADLVILIYVLTFLGKLFPSKHNSEIE